MKEKPLNCFNIAKEIKDLDGIVTRAKINGSLSKSRLRQIFNGDDRTVGFNTVFHKAFLKSNQNLTPDLELVMEFGNRLLDEEMIPEDVANKIVKFQGMVPQK